MHTHSHLSNWWLVKFVGTHLPTNLPASPYISSLAHPVTTSTATQVPFKQYDGHQAAVMATYKGMRPDMPKDIPEPLSQLIRECWSPAYGQRPSFAEIVPRLQRLHDALAVPQPAAASYTSP